MYEEWINSIPNIVPNCYYNNACEYRKAEMYYKDKGNKKMSEYYRLEAKKENEKFLKVKQYETRHPIISKFIKINDLI